MKIIKDGVVLKFRRLYRGHSGNYSCVSHNVVGRVRRSVQLTVKGLQVFCILRYCTKNLKSQFSLRHLKKILVRLTCGGC